MTLSNNSTNLFSFLSRALVGLLFIPEGIGKITGFPNTLAYITAAHVPFPELAAGIGIVIEVGLAALLLIGYHTRWVALAMIVYVIVLSFLFHAYWGVPAPQVTMQKLNFYKNLAIAGGLFAVVAIGPGQWSVDGKLGRA